MVRKFSFKVKHCNLTTTNNATVAYETSVVFPFALHCGLSDLLRSDLIHIGLNSLAVSA
jgi:hypothetical protein